MKRVLVLILIILFLCGLFSCGTVDDSKRVEFKVAFWGSTEELAAIKKIAEKIEDDLPNVKLKLEHIPVGGDPTIFSQKILTEAAGGTAPDIAFCEVNLFVDLYNKGVFIPLNGYIKNDHKFNIKNYFPSIVKRFTVKDQIYILPRDVAPFAVLYYNKDLLDSAGLAYPKDDWNVYQLLDYAKKLTKTDASGTVVQYGFYTWAWLDFIYSWGGSLVDSVENPKVCLMNRPESVAALQFYLDMMYKHKVMPTPSNLQAGYQELFRTGRLAMYCVGIWETPQLRQGLTFDWDVVMFPKGPTGKRGFASGGSGYGILKWCKDPKLAWEILKRLASADAQVDLAKIGLAQPADRNLAASDAWALSKEKPYNKKMLNEAVNYIIFDPFTPKWNEIWRGTVLKEMDMVFLNKAKLKPTLDKVTAEVNKALKAK